MMTWKYLTTIKWFYTFATKEDEVNEKEQEEQLSANDPNHVYSTHGKKNCKYSTINLEMIFCDATSSLDLYNTSVLNFFKQYTYTSGIPLGVIISLDEQQSTIEQGIGMLLDDLPETAFCGKRAKVYGLALSWLTTLLLSVQQFRRHGQIRSFYSVIFTSAMDIATRWQEQHQTTRQDHPDTKSERPIVYDQIE